jgi:hypothetical protein
VDLHLVQLRLEPADEVGQRRFKKRGRDTPARSRRPPARSRNAEDAVCLRRTKVGELSNE